MFIVGCWIPVYDNRDGRCGSRFILEPGLPAYETLAMARRKASNALAAIYDDVMRDGMGGDELPEPAVLEVLPDGSTRRPPEPKPVPWPVASSIEDDIPF